MARIGDTKEESEVIKCETCNGRGKDKYGHCSRCKGTGKLKVITYLRYNHYVCKWCNGTGRVTVREWTGRKWPDGSPKEGTGKWVQKNVSCSSSYRSHQSDVKKWEEWKNKTTEPTDEGCHITQVVCYGMGLSDTCHELTEIRRFRDKYLRFRDKYLKAHGYANDVNAYYSYAPDYAKKIQESAEVRPELYNNLYNQFIEPAVSKIEKNEMESAHRILLKYLKFVEDRFVENDNSPPRIKPSLLN